MSRADGGANEIHILVRGVGPVSPLCVPMGLRLILSRRLGEGRREETRGGGIREGSSEITSNSESAVRVGFHVA